MIGSILSRLRSAGSTRALDRFAERQLASNDCGLAVCKTALNLCGIAVPRHQLREALSFDEEGSSFEDIKRTLLANGVPCGYRVLEPGNLSLEGLAPLLPCLVMVEAGKRNHYLLLHSVTPTGVVLLDPQKGSFEQRGIEYLRENLSRIASATDEDVTLAYVSGHVARKCAAMGLSYDGHKPKAQLVMDYNKVAYFESLQERLGFADDRQAAAYLRELLDSEDDAVVPSRFRTFRMDAAAVVAKSPIALAFTPGAGAAKEREEASPATPVDSIQRFLAGMLRVPEQRNNLKRLLYIGMLTSLTTMVIVYTNQILLDEVIPSGELSTLYAFVSVLLLVRGSEFAMNLVKSYVQVALGRDLDGWLCGNLHERLVHSTFESVSSYSRGEISLRLNDLLRIKSVVSTFITDYLFNFIVLALALLLSAWVSLKVAAVIVCVSACYWFIQGRASGYVKSLESMRFTAKSEVVNSLINIVEGHGVIAKNGCEVAFLDDQKIRVDGFLGVQFRSMLASHLLVYIPRFVAILGSLAVIVISARAHLIAGELSIGEIFTLIALGEMCFAALRTILRTRLALQEQAVVVDRYFDLVAIEQRPQVPRDDASVHEVRIDGLDYRYPGSAFTLRADGIALRAGDRVIIGGANGSGKSTFLKLLSGLLQKNVGGTIGFHAADGTPMAREQGFNRVALVRAEDKIFSDTIGFNITLSNQRGGRKVYEYARKVGAEDFISPHSNPVDSIIHDQGANLSTGQRRKLLILRVLFSRADIIILDEIFRGIDAASKRKIIDTLNAISPEKIIIHTTHEGVGHLRINRRLEVVDGNVRECSAATVDAADAMESACA